MSTRYRPNSSNRRWILLIHAIDLASMPGDQGLATMVKAAQ
ncbi:hypothetical protein [Neosynechococcus sphagnicola]|nr:hypothetical protein [Neosynechococcus sphagnicola]